MFGRLVDISDDDDSDFEDIDEQGLISSFQRTSIAQGGGRDDGRHRNRQGTVNSNSNNNNNGNGNNNILSSSPQPQQTEIIAIGGGSKDSIIKLYDDRVKTSKKMIDAKTINEQQTELDKKITNLLTTIERPWSFVEVDGPICSIEGELYKKRFNSTWKKYYFALNGNNLYYYKSKNAKKPKGIISISFISPPIVLSEKNIVDMKAPSVSNYFLQVFSHKRIDSLCAINNEDFEKWCNVLQRLVKNTLDMDDYTSRFQAFQEVYPLFEKKSEMELSRLLLLLAEIDNKSTHIIGKAKKEKTGNLLMMEDDEQTGEIIWKQYYFALLDKCLYFYKSSKMPPQGVITLKYTDIQICDTTISSDLQYSFKLTTPLSVFILKAKHQVAMEDWVDTLMISKTGNKNYHIEHNVGSMPLNLQFEQPFSSSSDESQNHNNNNNNNQHSSNNNQNNNSNINNNTNHHNQNNQQQQQQQNNNNHNNNNNSISSASGGGGTLNSLVKSFLGGSTSSQPVAPMTGGVFTGLGKKYIPILTYAPLDALPTAKPKKVKMSLGSNSIGRSESCNITIDDKKVSRMHCKIDVSDTQCILLDMGSGHGTKVNRKTIDRHVLEIGDSIKIGKTKLQFNVVKK